MSADYEALNDQLKNNIISILRDWLPGGGLIGKEYTCGDIHGKKGKSFKVNIDTCVWKDFASGEGGGDLISLYAKQKTISNFEAFKILANLPGVNLPTVSPLNPKFPKLATTTDIPPELHEPPIFKLGSLKATSYWTYKNEFSRVLFYVARFDTKDGKEFRPYTWRDGAWANKAYPVPRPLYGLELLKDNLDKPVLICEGEKATEAARELCGSSYICISWPNGSNSVDKTDWSPLKGRSVLIWPDNDEAGIEAGKKIIHKINKLAKQIKILKVNETDKPEGWDAADALAEGLTYKEFLLFAKPIAQLCEQLPDTVESPPLVDPKPESKALKPVRYASWGDIGLKLNGSGSPYANVLNASLFLEFYIGDKFDFWYDQFHQNYFIKWPGKDPAPWQDSDDNKLLVIAQRDADMGGLKPDHIIRAAHMVANNRQRNAPRDYFNSLTWDGTPRVQRFFQEYMGVTDSLYTSAVSKNFWVAMIARVFSPGCKFDNMVILEGGQGKFKSTALEVIGKEWYAVVDEAFGTKDFYQKMQGHLLMEIGELDSFQKTQVTTIKNVLSQRTDKFRPPYGRNTMSFPRQCILVGTTNSDDYLRDSTGGRRFWPVEVTSVDLIKLKRDRDQLFAEAVHMYMAGHTYHEVPLEEAKQEQENRTDVDVWQEDVHYYTVGKEEVTIPELLKNAIHLDIARAGKKDQMRMAYILNSLGWKKFLTYRSGKKTRAWKRVTAPQTHTPDLDEAIELTKKVFNQPGQTDLYPDN